MHEKMLLIAIMSKYIHSDIFNIIDKETKSFTNSTKKETIMGKKTIMSSVGQQ